MRPLSSFKKIEASLQGRGAAHRYGTHESRRGKKLDSFTEHIIELIYRVRGNQGPIENRGSKEVVY